MAKIYTENDLLRFIYKETSPEETTSIARELALNPELYSAFMRLREEIAMTKEIEVMPSEASIQIVMEEAEHREKVH